MFVDGKKYKATQGLWELITKSKPDRNVVSMQEKQAYKQIILQSIAHRVKYSPSRNIKANKSLNIRRLFLSPLLTKV